MLETEKRLCICICNSRSLNLQRWTGEEVGVNEERQSGSRRLRSWRSSALSLVAADQFKAAVGAVAVASTENLVDVSVEGDGGYVWNGPSAEKRLKLEELLENERLCCLKR